MAQYAAKSEIYSNIAAESDFYDICIVANFAPETNNDKKVK